MITEQAQPAYVVPSETAEKAPKPFKRIGPDLLQVKEGGGFLSFFGLPFLAGGIFMTLAALKIIPFSNANQLQGWEYPLIGLMAVIFCIVGGGLVLGRRWITIDRQAATVTKSKGLLVPMSRETESLHPFKKVRLRMHAGDSDSHDRYPVSLKSESAELLLHHGTSYADGYRQAMYVATFLDLPLEEATTDRPKEMRPAQSGEPATEQVTGDAAFLKRVNQPLDMKSRLERGNGVLTVTIPAPKLRIWNVFPNLLSLGVAMYILSQFSDLFGNSNTPHEIGLGFVGLVLLFFVLIPTIGILRRWLHSRFGYSRLTISRTEIAFTEKSVIRKRESSVALSDLIDIDYHTAKRADWTARREARHEAAGRYPAHSYNPQDHPTAERILTFVAKFVRSKGIVIKSTKGMRWFGGGLPDDEVAYLAYEIRSWLRRAAG